MNRIFVLTLGDAEAAEKWRDIPSVARVITFEGARPDGRRWGKRALGLGIDAAVVAIKAAVTGRPDAYLATNPWIAIALRAFTRRPIVVTGIYAVAHSRQWKLLHRFLRRSLIIVWSEVETHPWNEAGGKAVAVLYGNTFNYVAPENQREEGTLRIFVGGSSDRDPALIRMLRQQVLDSKTPVRLDIAVGGEPSVERASDNEVRTHGSLSQSDFGALMGQADVVYLPLTDRPRAAGHMIMAGALELGRPVVTTYSQGMAEYVDGVFVALTTPEDALSTIRGVAQTYDRDEVRRHWEKTYSRDALMGRIAKNLETSTIASTKSYIKVVRDSGAARGD